MAPKRGKNSSTSPPIPKQEKQYVVEAIVNKRLTADGQVEYLLKWQGHPESEKSWEPEYNLNCPELIEKFNKFQKRMEKATPIGLVDEILGAARMNNEIYYLVKYAGTEKSEFLPSRLVKLQYTQLVIKFYETRYTEDR